MGGQSGQGQALAAEVLDRPAETEVGDETIELILAALDGSAALDAALGGTPPARPASTAREQPRETTEGVYLTAISARAFRGIGSEATLKLDPGPGLTVVVGSNGSGRSSLAEVESVLRSITKTRALAALVPVGDATNDGGLLRHLVADRGRYGQGAVVTLKPIGQFGHRGAPEAFADHSFDRWSVTPSSSSEES